MYQDNLESTTIPSDADLISFDIFSPLFSAPSSRMDSKDQTLSDDLLFALKTLKRTAIIPRLYQPTDEDLCTGFHSYSSNHISNIYQNLRSNIYCFNEEDFRPAPNKELLVGTIIYTLEESNNAVHNLHQMVKMLNKSKRSHLYALIITPGDSYSKEVIRGFQGCKDLKDHLAFFKDIIIMWMPSLIDNTDENREDHELGGALKESSSKIAIQSRKIRKYANQVKIEEEKGHLYKTRYNKAINDCTEAQKSERAAQREAIDLKEEIAELKTKLERYELQEAEMELENKSHYKA